MMVYFSKWRTISNLRLFTANAAIIWDEVHNELELVTDNSPDKLVVRPSGYRSLLSALPACTEIVSGLELNAENFIPYGHDGHV
jgi:hypothetical protein